jgi:three-Cys-motif partner protein
MPRREIEAEPFSEGTLTKLEIFQLYTRAWLPVFTSPQDPPWQKLAIFDLFSGEGQDCAGTPGSALRVLAELKLRWHEVQSKGIHVSVHLSDSDPAKIRRLKELIAKEAEPLPGIEIECQAADFRTQFQRVLPLLQSGDVACLLILDQYGFKLVDVEVFQKLTECPTTDVLFFVSSSYLHRFSDQAPVRRYIELERAGDYFHAHRAVYEWYRNKIPPRREYYLAPFSFRKGTNIYGVIFGSGHPRGLHQFLSVAWQRDQLNGEADYDLNREDFKEEEPFLKMDLFEKPKKTAIFEVQLRLAIESGRLSNERELYLFCLENGMLPKHAAPVLKELKEQGRIKSEFTSPSRKSLHECRPFMLIGAKRTTDPS